MNEHNPPAFPRQRGNNEFIDDSQEGMTLRDYFAAKVLPTFISITSPQVFKDMPINAFMKYCVEASYNYADAMLVERSKEVKE